jgi:biotin-dependent carboxylase-like uncharacterized protein
MNPCLRVLSPGLSATIQDVGRPGFQRFGVPMSGALDPWSLQAANLLVGNDPGMGALEITYCGPTFIVEAESVRLAFAGGIAPIHVFADATTSMSRIIRPLQSVRLCRGQLIRVGSINTSSLLYLAVEGGFDVPVVLGSVSTFVRGALGGLHGRALREGDKLPLVMNEVPQRTEHFLPHGLPPPQTTFRIMPGPQADYFAPTALDLLCDSEYAIETGSDRTGMRLDGPSIPHIRGYDIASDALAPGSIQIPGTQKPIVLLADRPTTGGYPKIATVISADLPALGRAPIGSKIAFNVVTAEAAMAARRELMVRMNGMKECLVPLDIGYEELSARLLNDNLVSGIFDACA